MTLAEKIGQLVQINASGGQLPDALKERLRQGRLGSMLNEIVPAASQEIQRIAVEESRLGIPLLMGRDVIHGYRTIFPIPLAQAAAWNPQLVTDCAAVAAEEAAAAGFQWTFAPMMDIARDPRWGRIAEGFGEDPYLATVLAAAMVRGFQGDDYGAPNRIAACAKHFAGYGAAEGGRDYDTAWIPEGLLRDVYLPPFKAAVDAGAATVMTSFNEINGVPSSGSEFLLRQVLRDEWGFKGFVVSDWDSMSEMIEHGFAKDLPDVAVKSIAAGVDMEMQSSAYADHLEALVKVGAVPQKFVDEAVRNVLRVKLRAGLFDTRRPFAAKVPGPPSAAALELAKTAAVESVVLLKNEGGALPLARSIVSVAVIGPLADDPYEVLGTWNRDGQIADTVTPLAAIRSLLGAKGRVRYAAGLPHSRSRDTAGFAAAVEAARQSDVALVFVGEEAILSGEAHSRAHLDLPGAQKELVDAVAAAGKPVVLVVLAGRPLTIPDVFAKARAVLYAWHPGTMTGPALADLLFGVASPSGEAAGHVPEDRGADPRLLRAQEHRPAADGPQAHADRRHPAARPPELARRRLALPRHRLRAALPVRLRPLVHELPVREPPARVRAGEARRHAARGGGPHEHRRPRGRRDRAALRPRPRRQPDAAGEGAEGLPAREARRPRDEDARVRPRGGLARLPRARQSLRRRAGRVPPLGRRRLGVRARGRLRGGRVAYRVARSGITGSRT